jgi:hypothetical protein
MTHFATDQDTANEISVTSRAGQLMNNYARHGGNSTVATSAPLVQPVQPVPGASALSQAAMRANNAMAAGPLGRMRVPVPSTVRPPVPTGANIGALRQAAGGANVIAGGVQAVNGVDQIRHGRVLDGALNVAGGAANVVNGGATLAGNSALGRQAGIAGGVIQMGQGVVNLARGGHNRADTVSRGADGRLHATDHAAETSAGVQQVINGALSTGGSALGSSQAGILMRTAALGMSAGNAVVTATDAAAQRDGTFGVDSHARATRGVGGEAIVNNAGTQNASGSEDAATQGARTYQNQSAAGYHFLHDTLGVGEQTAIGMSDTYGMAAGAVSTVGHSIANAATGVGNMAASGISSARRWLGF